MVAEGIFVTGLLTAYCTVEDVQRLLAGHDLSRLGGEEAVEERIRELLGPTRAALDAQAGRDFLFHADDEALLDGSGTDRVSPAQWGLHPVERVHGLWVDGAQVPEGDYATYGLEGTIRLRARGRLGGRFPAGVQNVVVALDWGYPAPPAEISLAQAKLIGAQMLSEAAGAQGSVSSVRLGDYAVSYDAGGEHAGVIARWVLDAQRAAERYRAVRLAAV